MRPLACTLLLVVVAVGAGCSPKPDPQVSDCPAPRPAFSLLVRAASHQPLPESTRIEVVYGGSAHEDFDLTHPPASPQVVFCGVVPPGSTPDGGLLDAGKGDDAGEHPAVEQIACQLWTDGAANVTVEAEGLATARRTLEAKTDGCGIVTTEVVIELVDDSPKDGGTAL